MRFSPRHVQIALELLLLVAASGCLRTLAGQRDHVPIGSTGSDASSGTAGGSSSGTGTSGRSAGTGGSASTAASGGNGSSGTAGATSASSSTGGGGNTGSQFWGGGYAYCSLSSAADGGPKGDGGPAVWMCRPGTYFCDFSGDIGNCFQCQSDADCANQALPTYDPRRQHCDVGSGIAGYQNFCQQCVGDPDCAGNPAGSFCDISPNFPLGALEPAIVGVGFETCGRLQTDCRIDGGPQCNDGLDQLCEQDSGWCVPRSGRCASDKDCAGLLSRGYYSAPTAPFCVRGYCDPCDGGQCPIGSCESDRDCGNLLGPANSRSCQNGICGCTNDSECADAWPVCVGLDGGPDGQGQPIATCGCNDDRQCGDAGLICLQPLGSPLYSYCGLPCTSPQAPSCILLNQSLCNAATGQCEECTSSAQCQGSSSGDVCDLNDNGLCVCSSDSDCAPGQTCTSGPPSTCTFLIAACTRASCPSGEFCDWDSGVCGSSPSCLMDMDCSTSVPFCDQDGGLCVECLTNADCVNAGFGAMGESVCCQPGDDSCSPYVHTCTNDCHTDQDCSGSAAGPACLFYDGGYGLRCGCGSDADCAASALGSRCEADPTNPLYGSCSCESATDCEGGQSCQLTAPNNVGQCVSQTYCQSDTDCPAETFCDPNQTCRARCDPGHACSTAEPACDTGNVAQQNGQSSSGAAPAVVWCYQCLTGNDCPGTEGCSGGFYCGPCGSCATGKVCAGLGGCVPACDNDNCPNGRVCATFGPPAAEVHACIGCRSPADCPNGLGCNEVTSTCGTCLGPNVNGGPFDCPPGAACSNYWTVQGVAPGDPLPVGVCLADCDLRSCPASQPLCRVVPSLSSEHRYCVGCLVDSDCAALGPNAWCDVSVNRTYSCQPGST